jgi:NTP pyrophosphatase (non-canonical NTP hydrolase)
MSSPETLRDLQTRIGEWLVATFGPNDPHSNQVSEVRRKLDEEVEEFRSSQGEHSREEAADIVIVLLNFAHRSDFDLMAEVERKFAIVKARRDQRARDIERGIPCGEGPRDV